MLGRCINTNIIPCTLAIVRGFKHEIIVSYVNKCQDLQHNPAILNSLISKFHLYRSSICSPVGHNINTKDDQLYRNFDISKYSSRAPEL